MTGSGGVSLLAVTDRCVAAWVQCRQRTPTLYGQANDEFVICDDEPIDQRTNSGNGGPLQDGACDPSYVNGEAEDKLCPAY
ncbi:MAG: hypothetical protein H0W40_01135 [Methylibium sp.]|uniref:hypothetical protein n=1 Tax=Methylibium sp. TaxID=2067992 RepID=UPI0017B639F7|nr:hypothetical protein [Methylibium sp.]MBA3595978.1 hypothetical protein [Methylibium sp.]